MFPETGDGNRTSNCNRSSCDGETEVQSGYIVCQGCIDSKYLSQDLNQFFLTSSPLPYPLCHVTYGTGNEAWSKNFPTCEGKKQSPIDIQTNKLLENKSLQPLVLKGYEAQSGHFPLINNGHSVQWTLPANMHIIEGLPYEFTAVQLHLHWRNATQFHGSEHTINGVPADSELHIVHFNSEKYQSFEEAQDKPDGLAVIAILITAEKNNKNIYYENLFSNLHKIQNPGENVTLTFIDVQHMLPCNLKRYYRYYGSLTTPPCTENVIWTVLAEHVFISTEQLYKLFSLKDNFSHSLQNNFRHVQPLNERIVQSSFPPEEAEGSQLVRCSWSKSHSKQQFKSHRTSSEERS
ncbi:carbonic anhydrase 6 isoform X2 [Sminthopsis crassicaudata]|uniref:carbonic anhydrase 6 isoform X2 n=1 Tax=Sminthopsis crassicaudata TaxID=9301 RepID=UPI003D684195